MRLQGTDGIRREVRLAGSPELEGMSPQQVFLQKGIITEEFMELYTFAHVRSLMQEQEMRPGESIVIGWDPRDWQGNYNQAAVRGIRKAGAGALVLGIVPTPLVPMFMLYKNAGGGFMVTASHNPNDQNGIKTFLAYRGMKLLPGNDLRLTSEVLKTDYQALKKLPLKGMERDARTEALEFFRRVSLAPENSWAEKQSGCFKDTLLVVDPANGALSGIAADILRRAGFAKVIETNARLDGNVNLNSGVADLEGHQSISREMIAKGAGKFRQHRAVLKLFGLGDQHKSRLLQGELKLCGAVFDADGDRFYRLDYDPYNDCLLVLSGDETAYLQAKYLITRNPERYRGTRYINTVESDLNTALVAEKTGFVPMLTPVGDKWILLRVATLILEARIRDLKAGTGKTLPPAMKKAWDAIRKYEHPDVAPFRDLEEKLSSLEAKAARTAKPSLPSFAVGSEETGHNITSCTMEREDGGVIPVFFGNGLKSALNTFAATADLLKNKTPQKYYSVLRRPFPPGFKHTLYTYYVRKDLFCKDSLLWKKVKRLVIAEAKARGYTARAVPFAEDPDMLYIALVGQKSRQAAVFIRNSGTENKTGINLRGAKQDEGRLREIGEQGIRLLMQAMKDTEDHYYKLELDVLSQIADESVPEKQLILEKRSRARLLMEMSKQRLIRLTEKGYQRTPLGKWYTAATLGDAES